MACGPKLLAELWRLLDNDPEIDELGFLLPAQLAQLHDLPATVKVSFGAGDNLDPGENSCDGGAAGSKYWFWLGNHKLAIAVNALGPLYKEAMALFLAMRKEEKDKQDLNGNASKVDGSLLKVTKVLVIVNSDHSTAWNTRKQVLCKLRAPESEMLSELRLSSLVLTYAPKSEEAWAHRRWALKKLFSVTSSSSPGIIESEGKLVDGIVQRSLMNYRAWKHRCWLISFMKYAQIETELKFRDAYRCTDNCFFHYRRSMLQQLMWRRHEFGLNWRQLATIWKEELDWNAELVNSRSFGHEALWIHRRFLAHGLLTSNGLSDHFNFECFQDEEANKKLVSFVMNDIKLTKAFTDGEAQEHSSSYKLWLFFLFRKKHASKEVETLLQEESCTAAASTPHKRCLWKVPCNFSR